MADTSTVTLALIGAYWFLVALFLLLSLLFGVFAFARAGVSPRIGYRVGVATTALAPAAIGAGVAFEGNPTGALILSAAAILFSLWWLHNMAKREP